MSVFVNIAQLTSLTCSNRKEVISAAEDFLKTQKDMKIWKYVYVVWERKGFFCWDRKYRIDLCHPYPEQQR